MGMITVLNLNRRGLIIGDQRQQRKLQTIMHLDKFLKIRYGFDIFDIVKINCEDQSNCWFETSLLAMCFIIGLGINAWWNTEIKPRDMHASCNGLFHFRDGGVNFQFAY